MSIQNLQEELIAIHEMVYRTLITKEEAERLIEQVKSLYIPPAPRTAAGSPTKLVPGKVVTDSAFGDFIDIRDLTCVVIHSASGQTETIKADSTEQLIAKLAEAKAHATDHIRELEQQLKNRN